VHFLNEEQIIEAVVDKIQTMLAKNNDSRTFEYQVCFVHFLYRNLKEDAGDNDYALLLAVDLAHDSAAAESDDDSESPRQRSGRRAGSGFQIPGFQGGESDRWK
jgi:hypothetical protein